MNNTYDLKKRKSSLKLAKTYDHLHKEATFADIPNIQLQQLFITL